MGKATIEDIEKLEQIKRDLAAKKEDWEKKSETYLKYAEKLIPECEKNFKEAAWDQILKENETAFQKAFSGLRGSKDRFMTELKKRIEGIPNHEGHICSRPVFDNTCGITVYWEAGTLRTIYSIYSAMADRYRNNPD